MTNFTRRSLLLSGGALTLAGCGNGIGSDGGPRIDARVDNAMSFMFSEVPGSQDLADQAAGMLVMPLITEAGFGFGGAYGRGALRINGATVDYYSAVSGSFGLQIGAQQYAHALFFMTQDALTTFRTSNGWAVGADAEYAINDRGGNLSAETITATSPVIALVFGQAGLAVGATLEGSKYSRIIP